MEFHVTITVHDAIVLGDDQQLRRVLGPQIGKILESGKVKGGGFFGGKRGAFFILDLDTPEEFYALLGPEVYSTCTVDAYPLIPFEKGAALFRQWDEEGR